MDEKLITQKCVEDIDDRILGVFNDLKAFLYIRINNLQHKEDKIGGGNIVAALSLFSALNFLAKTYYCTVKPDKFNDDGSSKNETESFVHFMKFIQSTGLDLGLPDRVDAMELLWSGFRNWLAHRLTVQPGNQVINFIFEVSLKSSIEESLSYAKSHKVFQYDESSEKWIVNCDVLLAYLPDIVSFTTKYLKDTDGINNNLLLKVIGTEYP